MYTVKYRIWVRPGQEKLLESVWREQVAMLAEMGLVTGWVVARSGGECLAYLQWRERQYWESVRKYCRLMDEVARAMDENMLGWLSEYPCKGLSA